MRPKHALCAPASKRVCTCKVPIAYPPVASIHILPPIWRSWEVCADNPPMPCNMQCICPFAMGDRPALLDIPPRLPCWYLGSLHAYLLQTSMVILYLLRNLHSTQRVCGHMLRFTCIHEGPLQQMLTSSLEYRPALLFAPAFLGVESESCW